MDELIVRISDANNIEEQEYLNSSFLSERDKEEIQKMKAMTIRKEKIISSYFKRKYVGDYYFNNKGKPLSDNTFFNISHSHGMVAFVKNSKYNIGIDIEKIDYVSLKMRRYITTDEEYSFIKTEEDFYDVWTNKESLVKTLGTGIVTPMRDIPGLPINNRRDYLGQIFYSQTIRHNGFVITVTMQTENPFLVKIVNEQLPL